MAVAFDGLNEGQEYEIDFCLDTEGEMYSRNCFFHSLSLTLPRAGKPTQLVAIFVNSNNVIVECLTPMELVDATPLDRTVEE